jgi:predicted metal-dependent hydrolase
MKLDYQIIYSKRKNLGITVERDRSVVVRAPFGFAEEKIQAILETKKLWLYEKIQHSQKYADDYHPLGKELVSGESMPYLGRNYRLQVIAADSESMVFKQKFIIHKTAQTQANALFKAWYILKAEQKITPRVALYAKNLGLKYNAVKIADVKYRWGSCTPNDNLIFNWRLIKAPMLVIDYIIVHELAHLIESNHSAYFWRIVKTNAPDYEKAKDWLKQHGELLEQDFGSG